MIYVGWSKSGHLAERAVDHFTAAALGKVGTRHLYEKVRAVHVDNTVQIYAARAHTASVPARFRITTISVFRFMVCHVG